MATKAKKPIPDGYHSITPSLVVRGASEAIEFYKKAFGAEELFRMPGPGGKVMHAELKIGDSIVMLADEFDFGSCRSPATLKGATGGLLIYVPDADAAWKRATDAGAKVAMPLADMFWGDRFGTLTDPFGQVWSLATHVEDVGPEEIAERVKKLPPPQM